MSRSQQRIALARLAELDAAIAKAREERPRLAGTPATLAKADRKLAKQERERDTLLAQLGLVRGNPPPMRRALPWWPFPSRYDAKGRPVYEVQYLE